MSSSALAGQGAATAAAGSSSGAEDEVLYQSVRSLVVRCRPSGGSSSLVLKKALNGAATQGLRHEKSVLQRLAAVDGVPKLAPGTWNDEVLALRDNGGKPLVQVMAQRRLSIDEVLQIGRQLSRTLAGVHKLGVVHKDVNPSNILLAGNERRPVLIDFNMATVFAEERAGFTHESQIAGTLSSMAPEQTGRTGRPVDPRSDLYSLGAVLFQAIANRLLFQTDDLLELLHHQLTTVPPLLTELVPETPPLLSALVQRLLEKDPDRRYQSAEGLANDFERLIAARSGHGEASFTLGEFDFAVKLVPPSRQIGRTKEREQLTDALHMAATQGQGVCVLLNGAAGSGKTALANELRMALTGSKGWFVSGRFDQHRHDSLSATVQALAGLGQLLLSEPEDALAVHRARLTEALGANINAGITLIAEFRLLLGDHPRPKTEPVEAQRRMIQGVIDVLRCVASQERPLVLLLDDFQWATDVSLRFIDMVLAARAQLPGLLLVMAYRPQDVIKNSLLDAKLREWRQLDFAPKQLALGELELDAICQLVGEMLRLPANEAAQLGSVLSERTRGNALDTIELINGLRADGLLEPGPAGWQWEEAAIRRYVGKNDGLDIISKRLAKLPPACLSLMEALFCLGSNLPLDVLGAACGMASSDVLAVLIPALEDGLLVAETGLSEVTLRFRNSRVEECVQNALQHNRREMPCRLSLARRLALHAEYERQAARLYLGAIDEVTDVEERRRAVALLQKIAQQLQVTDYTTSERFLSCAIQTLKSMGAPDHGEWLTTLLSQHHLALCGLGRHDEADQIYARIAQYDIDPLSLAETAGAQVQSLANRGLWAQALALGLQVMASLNMPKPDDMDAAIGGGLQELRDWALAPAKQTDFDRPECSEPQVLVAADFLKRILASAYNEDLATYTWVTLQAHRLWTVNGPCAALMPTIASVPLILMLNVSDYRAAHAAGCHAVAVGLSRGYEPGTSSAHVMSALGSTHWGQPIEDVLEALARARKGLMQANDVQYVHHIHSVGAVVRFETATSLEQVERACDDCIAFDTSMGNGRDSGPCIALRQVARGLRGQTRRPGGFEAEDFDEKQFMAWPNTTSAEPGYYHSFRAVSAALFNDAQGLVKHSQAAMAEMPFLASFYVSTHARLCHGLARAATARSASGKEREAALADVDAMRDWMRERAIDAPANFSHLAHWLDAEYDWSVGNHEAARRAFELGLSDLDGRSRPWHRALMQERVARLCAAAGWDHSSRLFMSEALRSYGEWGAAGKVNHLLAEFSFLQRASNINALSPRNSTTGSGGAVDMLAILRASQAISSETSLPRLSERLSEVLSAICGAGSMLLAVRPREMPGWYVAASLEKNTRPVSIDDAAGQGLLVLSAFRYAERTREPLLVRDAVRDHRFAADTALEGLRHCSMLLVPVVKHNELQAMLVLENRERHDAFAADRMDAVSLIAGQLAVSLDNALLYASLERTVAERGAALEQANQQLERLSVMDALTGLANRRQFDQALAAEWARAAEQGSPIGLAMIGIDQFKQYNDHHGHSGGDTCLRLVAEAMKAAMRSDCDLLARYGGKEFVLLLRDSDLEGSRAVAERVRTAVAEKMQPHPQAKHGIVTVSVGLASTIPAKGSSPNACLEEADAALYQAKQGGRNCIVIGSKERSYAPQPASATLEPIPLRRADAPALKQSLELMSHHSQVGTVRWDARRAELFVSEIGAAMLGCSPNGLRLSRLMRVMQRGDRRRVLSECKVAVGKGERRIEIRFDVAGDPVRHFCATVALSYSPGGRPVELVIAFEDISHSRRVAAALLQSQARLREAQNMARLSYWEWDYSTQRGQMSASLLRRLGLPADAQPTWKQLHELSPEDKRGWIAQQFLDAYAQKLPTLRYEINYSGSDGTMRHVHTMAKIEYGNQGEPQRVMATVQDVSELKSYRRKLHSLSFFDPLTSLPNRALFVQRLREACSEAAWQQQQLGVLMLDIDRFKDINDSLGHSAGDALLQQVAERLGKVLRGHDTISRMGGDEFAVLLREVRQPNDMDSIAQKVFSAFSAPFVLMDKEVFVSPSIGGAMYPDNAKDDDQLLQFADAALYHAKAQGRNNYKFYAAELTSKAAERLSLEAELRRAAERGEFELYFQPKLDLATGQLIGAEALMRWNHPERGMISPVEFIPVAEETGLIVSMGEWALNEVCRRTVEWNAASAQPIKVAVNLSARQLMHGNLADVLHRALDSSGCKPQWLELEITESLLLDGQDEVRNLLQDIAHLGITIAIDDFGTGYSSLSYLARFPIHVLKIDRSFVKQLPDDRSGIELVKAIVSLGHSMGMELVAEGVETPEQARTLIDLGCQKAQGFLYGKPLPRELFESFMRTRAGVLLSTARAPDR